MVFAEGACGAWTVLHSFEQDHNLFLLYGLSLLLDGTPASASTAGDNMRCKSSR